MTTLKSYLTDKQRSVYRLPKEQELLYLKESVAATIAGDSETSWAWLSHVTPTLSSLVSLKFNAGAQFIRDKNLITTPADEAFGEGWMELSDDELYEKLKKITRNEES